MNGLENILRVGQLEACKEGESGVNPYATLVEECGGTDKIEFLQQHENTEIYVRAYEMLEKYFGGGDEDRDDAAVLAPAAAGDQQTYQFMQSGDNSLPSVVSDVPSSANFQF